LENLTGRKGKKTSKQVCKRNIPGNANEGNILRKGRKERSKRKKFEKPKSGKKAVHED